MSNKMIRVIIAATWLLISGFAWTADQPAVAADGAANIEPAPLVIENRTVFTFRAPVLGRSPKARAEGAEYRIKRELDKRVYGAVTAREISGGTAIELDGVAMFGVIPGDIDELAGETMQSTVDRAVRLLTQAIGEARERSDTPRMLKAVGLALLSTLLYATLVYGVISGSNRLSTWLTKAFRNKASHLKIAGVIAVYPGQLVQSIKTVASIAAWGIALVALQVWLSFMLGLFPYTRPWGEQLGDYLLDLLRSILISMAHALPGLVTVAIMFAIARFIANMISSFFERIRTQQLRLGWLDEDTAKPTQKIVVFVIWVFAVVMAYPYLPGAQTEAFKGLSVLLGIMVSIGASGVVGQIASGMILMYARALRKGDFVKIGDAAEGTVTELGLLSTRIQTGTGEEVILPNAYVASNITRNFSREDRAGRAFALQVVVTIGYATPWRQVHAMLLEAAQRTKGVLIDPKPYVIQTALSDFYVEYKLVAYAGPEAPAQRALAVSDLNANVQDVFNQYGVQIMSPHYLGDPEQPQVVPPEKWFEAPAKKPDA